MKKLILHSLLYSIERIQIRSSQRKTHLGKVERKASCLFIVLKLSQVVLQASTFAHVAI
jgi:hypothetical protein